MDPSWKFLAAADLNDDGKADILWQNTAGQVVDWTMNGTTIAEGDVVGTVDSGWKFLTAANFAGDGKAEALWQNAGGEVVNWAMNGSSITAGATVALLNDTGTLHA